MIKAVLFDYGGVITLGGGGHEITERLAAILGVSEDKASELFNLFWDDFVCGKVTEDELWQRIAKATNSAIPPNRSSVWNTWTEHMKPQPEMLDLVKQLQKRKITVGLLSNVLPPTAEGIKEGGGYAYFDFVVLSCEVGLAKPDPKIYELALAKLPDCQPSEVVFVDDQEVCLEPARQLGIKTILAKNAQQITVDILPLIET